MKGQEIDEEWLIRIMRFEAEKILQGLTTPSSEVLMRIMYTELIDRVIKQIETNQQENQ